MRSRADKLTLLPEVERVGDASKILETPGQAVIVNRGHVRSIVFSCPDGCGELLTINLDPKAGKAWRLYRNTHGVTVFPSVWRDNGCKSHFVVWRNRIVWCGLNDRSSDVYKSSNELDARILAVLSRDKLVTYVEVADILNEIPWDILYSCINLVTLNKIKRGYGDERDSFKLI